MILRLTVTVLAALCAAAPAARAAEPAYIGSATCADCHPAVAAAWAPSDHGLAWTEPSEATVLGDFDGASFERDGVLTRFTRRGDAFVVETQGGDGARRAFEVVGVAGIRPLQQYLLAPAPGRTQAFDLAWDTERRAWFDLYPGQPAPPGDGMHWTGPYKSWEARCAECHATGYSRNYDPATRRYAPRMAETGVGCEACHGPGQAHAADPNTPTAPGLTADLAASATAEIEQCAGCHSRREAFADGNPLPGTPYHDAFSPALLRDGIYHADGQIDAEVYEYGSFLQSKMRARGVRCSDCHEPHALELRAEGNAVCTQCHAPAGNPRFPTLRRALYDDPSHHFHPPGSAGADCRNCHMPERTYMVVDGRRDHGFRVPRPDLAATGAPDACTGCHADRDPAWAAAEIARRFPASTHRGPHFATAFAAARRDPSAQADALIALARRPDLPGIVRASALDLLVPVADATIADRAAPLLADPDPLVRAAAATLQRGLPAAGPRLDRLLPGLRDPTRGVRIAAAKAMLGTTPSGASEAARATLAAATGEWRDSLLARADFPETHLQIGGAALGARNLALADAAFGEAVALDPQLVDAWAMLARIRAAAGDAAGARRALGEGLAANPGAPLLESLSAELGP